MEAQDLQFVIITGLSGAGKSQAMQSLEDQGYFCVDNLPPTFIGKFAELCAQKGGSIRRIAVACDLRGGEFFSTLAEALEHLRDKGIRHEILFLEASDEALVRRYKESRRRHPLSVQGRILDGIQQERAQLADLRGQADKIINTTNLSSRQLKAMVTEIYGDHKDTDRLQISIISFGFKYGIPMDADLVMDVRFLPNPFYVKELRGLTGEDEKVRDYVLKSEITTDFLSKFEGLLDYILPYYIKEGKNHLVVGIGCTGGQHRSVAIAAEIARKLKLANYLISIKHRDAIRNLKGGAK
ncbi:MAG TPA: RNase adapter RapZ [Desulfobacteria bacterium]|nr:RNase adapter RapZ [Desulfobacteria bacterium]